MCLRLDAAQRARAPLPCGVGGALAGETFLHAQHTMEGRQRVQAALEGRAHTRTHLLRICFTAGCVWKGEKRGMLGLHALVAARRAKIYVGGIGERELCVVCAALPWL